MIKIIFIIYKELTIDTKQPVALQLSDKLLHTSHGLSGILVVVE
jgi:hypothetical protein